MSPKCDSCDKIITRKSPGLECNKCNKYVHASTQCAGLTAKQLAAVKAADSLEWMCDDCKQNSDRRSSHFVPCEDTEEDDDVKLSKTSNSTGDINALREIAKEVEKNIKREVSSMAALREIAKEVEKNIKRELTSMTSSIEFLTDKMEEFTECMDAYKNRIKELEKKNTTLANNNTHLETKVKSLEQRMQDMEQKQLSCTIEVAGIPFMDNENTTKLIQKVAEKMNLDNKTTRNIKRTGVRAGQGGLLLVEFSEAGERELWLSKARDANVLLSDIQPDVADDQAKVRIFVREALTHYNKQLLWKTKQELREAYKYIWYKDGKVLVRKSDKSKIITVRSDDDIKNLRL